MIVVLPLPFLRNWVTSCIESGRDKWGAGGNAPSTSPGTRIFSSRLRLTLIVNSSRRLLGSRGEEIGREKWRREMRGRKRGAIRGVVVRVGWVGGWQLLDGSSDTKRVFLVNGSRWKGWNFGWSILASLPSTANLAIHLASYSTSSLHLSQHSSTLYGQSQWFVALFPFFYNLPFISSINLGSKRLGETLRDLHYSLIYLPHPTSASLASRGLATPSFDSSTFFQIFPSTFHSIPSIISRSSTISTHPTMRFSTWSVDLHNLDETFLNPLTPYSYLFRLPLYPARLSRLNWNPRSPLLSSDFPHTIWLSTSFRPIFTSPTFYDSFPNNADIYFTLPHLTGWWQWSQVSGSESESAQERTESCTISVSFRMSLPLPLPSPLAPCW